jgi:Restriction endonuclease AspBHI N-terminal/Restriction endonuclease
MSVPQIAERTYRLGHTYRDTGSSSNTEDEFLRWINIAGSGIRNMGGIRPLRFTSLLHSVPAYILLVTDARSTGSAWNPWEDLVELPAGRILYWGDAKFGRKTVDEFVGNRALASAWGQVLDNNRSLVPPILHFSKIRTGEILFNGLCVLDHLELTWFEDDAGRPVRNYRAHLTILDEEFVDVEWLHRRAMTNRVEELDRTGPTSWRRYQAGSVERLRIWAPSIRSHDAQLPASGSPDIGILGQLVQMSPTHFEAAVVSVFRQLEDVRHTITRTRPTADGGFDFFGTFILPAPLRYEISFLGEAKRFALSTAVQPKHVSRLVARLGRGQYGLFVTTSYFTKQTQEEVLADGYPTSLIAGADLVRMMRELRIARRGEIAPSWLRVVESEMAYGLLSPGRGNSS